MRLADNLMAIVSQRLIKRADGKGSVAAQEIMISNKGIADCIADPDKTHEINDFIIKSREISGGQTFDQHLCELYLAKMITLDTAKEAATSPADFERNLMYGGVPVSKGETGIRNKPAQLQTQGKASGGDAVELEGQTQSKESKAS